MEQIIPKKAEIQVAKCEGKINVVCIEQAPVFYNVRDGPYYPTLKIHHKYPFCMPTMRVDAGSVTSAT
jgi:PUA domain protein